MLIYFGQCIQQHDKYSMKQWGKVRSIGTQYETIYIPLGHNGLRLQQPHPRRWPPGKSRILIGGPLAYSTSAIRWGPSSSTSALVVSSKSALVGPGSSRLAPVGPVSSTSAIRKDPGARSHPWIQIVGLRARSPCQPGGR
jgi:hypothetical protein